jgi:hypothetical protein
MCVEHSNLQIPGYERQQQEKIPDREKNKKAFFVFWVRVVAFGVPRLPQILVVVDCKYYKLPRLL